MRSIVKKKYDLRIVLRRLSIYTIPILLIFNLAYSIIYNSQKNALITEYKSQQHEAISIVSLVLSTTFSETYNDLLLVKNSNEFSDYIENSSKDTFDAMEQMLFRVMSSKPDFIQLRYIDKDGLEVARVNNYNGALHIVTEDELQNKSDMYYMKSALNVPKDTMYISNLDLNIENGIIKIPYEPVMRFSIPIYRQQDLLGILIVNYDGYKILSILDEYVDLNNELVEVGVFDSVHYWQFKKGEIQENNILTISEIDEHIPLESRQDNFNEVDNYFESGNIIYHVHFFDELSKVKIKFEGENNHIGIISSFSIGEVIQNSDDIILKYPIIPYVISFIIVIFALIIIVLSYKKKADNLMLAASKYISEYTHDGIVITDRQRKVIYCNSVFTDTFGFSFEEVKDKRISEFLKSDTEIVLLPENGETIWEGNIWDKTKNSMYILKYLKIKHLYDKRNNAAYYIGIYSEPKVDQKILDKATWDNLPMGQIENNLLLGVDPIFEKGFEQGKEYIVIVIKISEFIDIKYRIREREGNSFVLNIAGRLKKVLSEDSMVFAPGSDLFLIRTRFHNRENEVNSLMAKIDSIFTSMSFIDYTSLDISYLSGVAFSPMHGQSGLELLTKAFIALEAIVKLKQTNYLIYNENIYDLVRKDKTIRSELGYAFENEEFSVLYQIQKTTSGKSIGVEALVRWENKRLGDVSPALFVPILEESEYISKLGMYVLKRVVDDFKTVNNGIPENFKISINLSSKEFMDKETVESLVDVIDSAELRLENFCFEITETTLVNNLDHTNEVIKYLHEKRILVSIDDFGTGYSSLGYLKNLYADKLKIDRAFIKDYPTTDDGTLLKAIVSLAQQLKKNVIVEGVETEEQVRFIESLNCHEYQGYYGSKPIKFKEFVNRFFDQSV